MWITDNYLRQVPIDFDPLINVTNVFDLTDIREPHLKH